MVLSFVLSEKEEEEAEDLPEPITGSVLVCGNPSGNICRRLLSEQLTRIGITNISYGREEGFPSKLRGHGNLVLLAIEYGVNMRLHDESSDAGYKDEVEAAKRLAENGEFAIVVFKDRYYHGYGYKYFDVNESDLSPSQILEIRKLIENLKVKKENIQIHDNSVPNYLKPTVLKSEANEFLLFWKANQARVVAITPISVTIESVFGTGMNVDYTALKPLEEQFKTWYKSVSQQTFQVRLSSNTTLKVLEVSAGNVVGVIIHSIKSTI